MSIGISAAQAVEIERLRAEREWQAIESAPRDTSILVYSPKGGIDIAVFCTHKWLTEYGAVNPTHWMPLPEPPEAEPKLHDPFYDEYMCPNCVTPGV